jgi:Flavin-binding monooxygenase-like
LLVRRWYSVIKGRFSWCLLTKYTSSSSSTLFCIRLHHISTVSDGCQKSDIAHSRVSMISHLAGLILILVRLIAHLMLGLKWLYLLCILLFIYIPLLTLIVQVYLSTRRGTWVLPRVWNKGLPRDAMYSRMYNYLCDIVPESLQCYRVEGILNARFDHAMYGLKPANRCNQQACMVNDDLPSRIISGSVIIKSDIKLVLIICFIIIFTHFLHRAGLG